LASRGKRRPARLDSLRGRLRMLDHQRLEAGLDCFADQLDLVGLARDPTDDAVTHSAHLALQ